MDCVQDIYDAFNNDLDPDTPVPEGDRNVSADATHGTSVNEGEEFDVDSSPTEEPRFRSGRKLRKPERFRTAAHAAMLSFPPTSASRQTNHDDLHRHFKYHAGGVRDREVTCGQ